ncbi:hypothetical protein BDV96DRAFT_486875 [Lophiotrema nucula]|uniref:Ribosomal protein S15 n=1 Tax=Lophiotrema nucula TaxID=690887 RepID=A0A6A5ZKF7_9PLEO|nr:hypothetical protein BDV96DRAFT_486875 [Lophiotrema nucula]
MPPRIPILQCLRAPKPPTPAFTLPLRPFSASPAAQGRENARAKKKTNLSHDPYIIAQRNRKKAANIARHAELEKQRLESLGDPVRGVSTPFVESFDTGAPLEHAPEQKIPQDQKHLNYALKPDDVQKSLEISKDLAVPRQAKEEQPTTEYQSLYKPFAESSAPKFRALTPEEIQKDHERASIAISRITALENGSSKDRMRVNIHRCVNTFGRHNTDTLLPPRAPALKTGSPNETHAIRPETNIEQTKKRIGPDTGSSEVQIAILTAKIKTLADFLGSRGKSDKHNKRNLRLLVHKRQKLLAYLKRKERGGPRWQHCIETLGLTEGTWKGEISL